MTKPEPARYRTTNWKSYNAALRRRGSLLIWLDKDMEWIAPKAGRLGRPPVFSDAAIQFCLMGKVLFRSSASANNRDGGQHPGDGWARLVGAGLLYGSSRRQKTLAVQISSRRAQGPLNLLVDSTGIKFLG